MTIIKRTGLAGFFVSTTILLSACGGSSTSVLDNSTDGQNSAGQQEQSGEPSNDDGQPIDVSSPGDNANGGDAPVVDGTPSDPDNGQPNTPVTDQTPNQPSNDDPVDISSLPNPDGVDLSGGDDDSPTAAESASLVGPFVKDTTRSAGPPSVPSGLTVLMKSDIWMEFSWIPSADDQSVEAYEIYRDGQLISTVRGDTNFEHDYRNWISTSYMDCNYTRFTNCVGVQPTPGTSYSYSVAAVDNEGMRSARSAPVVFTTEQLSSAPVDLNGYRQVFTEEFNEGSLDRSRWKTSLPWGPDQTINLEQQYFVNTFGSDPLAYDPFVLTGETLQITGIETPAELRQAANNKQYLSGVITTSDNFEMTYGYVEMSARVASGTGLLSTFYLFNQDFDKNKPEIDILEYIGSRPTKAYQTYHYFDSNRARYASGENHSTPTMEADLGQDLSSAFHTYAVLWEEGLAIWYIDGQEVRRVSGPRVSDEPMNIIAQLVVGSEWIGSPDRSAIPAVFEIDYIRAWQR